MRTSTFSPTLVVINKTQSDEIKTERKMRKILLLLILGIITISCNQTKKAEIVETRKIDPILSEIFEKDFSTYKENTLIKEKALKELIKKIDSLAPLNYLEDIPLEVFRVQKNPHGKGAIVQFTTDNFDRDKTKTLSNQLEYDLIVLMSEELASTINEKRKYLVRGKNYKRLNETETYLLVKQTYFSPEPEISEDLIWSGFYDFKVGVLLAEIDSLKIAK
jgi:hypothetical protein